MRQWVRSSLSGFLLTALSVTPLLAGQATTGNGAPSGPHYNLHIIGVDKGKTAAMTGSNRHTIFVALGSKNEALTTNIYLTQGPFEVCDGNGFDLAYDCNGNPINVAGSNKYGAVFQLPCDTATVTSTSTGTCPSGTSESYTIWAEALGTPGGSATITTCALDSTGTLICSTNNKILSRGNSKPTFSNVTTLLTTLTCTAGTTGCPCVSGTCSYEIFDNNFQQFLWQYDNMGLRNAEIRFYPQS